MALTDELRSKLDGLVQSHRVVLFMKGERRAPMCGFSAGVVDILDQMLPAYETVNILSDAAIRDGLKEYSGWPTFPQLYVDGKLVGGADIVKEMHQSGELAALFGDDVRTEPLPPPTITLTKTARDALAQFAAGEDEPLHLEVTLDFRHDLFFGPRGKADIAVDVDGLVILVDPRSATRAHGVRIDAVQTGEGLAFRIDNPNEPAKVRPVSARGLKELFERGTAFTLLDVRPAAERALASLPKAIGLDGGGDERIAQAPKDSMIVVMCHHGVRSRAAAEQLAAQGYTQVFNLEGGIDAWSREVDDSVPRY